MSKQKIKAADPNPQHIKKSILNRVGWLYVLFAVLGLAITVQIIVTQYGPNGEPLNNLSESMCYKVRPIDANRGNILSHDGRILTTDAPYYEIRLDWAIPGKKGEGYLLTDSIFYANLPALADSMSALFGEPSAHYNTQLREILARARGNEGGRRNIKLVDKVNQIELDRLRTFPLLNEDAGGFMFKKDTLRYKPFGSLAGYTLGAPHSHGLEYYYNDALTGEDGQNLTVRLVGSTWLPVLDTLNREARNGYDVVTTIDIDLQDVAESALRKQLADNQAMWGTAVVMEVATGEIRAMANLTHNSDGSITDNYNYAILSRNEPGSTFKLVSLMALLEQGGFKTTDMVDCGNGYAVVYKSEINDSHAVGKVTVKEMMEQSSNIGFARSIEKVYRENQTRFTDFIDSLGLNQRASIQQFEGYMPIIKDPRLGHRNDWNDLTLTKMSYGYALELTPMHTLMLYNAVASGGKMLAPIIVKELRNGDEVVEQYLPEVINPQICSPQVLADVKECLEGVVENGTASLLKNDNYRVAGKTGTAQMVQPHGGYTARDGGRDYLGTLVGYFPAEAPKYTCIVAIKTHHAPGSRNTYYGGALAGPVFKAITDRIYALDNEWRERVTPTSGRGAEVEARVGGESQLALSEQLLDVRSAAYSAVPVESKQVIDTAELYTKDWRVMPSVMGMGLRDAIYTLERAGLSVEISGVGEVVEQTPLPEELYLSGDKATIRLAPRPEPEPDEKEKNNNRKI